MSNLSKLEFAALDISGKNYLSWVLDAEIHLDAKGLGNTILADKEASNQDKAKGMIFIRHHLHERLKVEYLTVKDSLMLWNNLKERFDRQKMIILPKAHYDWMHLRLQEFNTIMNVTVYNNYENGKYRGRSRDRDRDCGHSEGRGRGPENAPIRIDVPIRQTVSAKESNPRLKRERPVGSKDKNPRKRKGVNIQDGYILEASAQEETKDITNQKTPEEV
ncbi:hypothetical protein J1N35_043576 [Gossypium stocksii]|uniref:Uncharacterized protein n=1 Tax=Gossypium stocksii TaxID=47602 RepID=A0A9D3ZF33_9ROSI|nr:hypothetical protein J1N35_043576 [Gossypium stocksii]